LANLSHQPLQIDLMWQGEKGMGTYQQLVAIIVGHAPSSTIKSHLTANTFIHFLINMQ